MHGGIGHAQAYDCMCYERSRLAHDVVLHSGSSANLLAETPIGRAKKVSFPHQPTSEFTRTLIALQCVMLEVRKGKVWCGVLAVLVKS